MKIEKLPSGNYWIRKMCKENTYSVTFDYKPTQKEALKAMSEALDKVKTYNSQMSFQEAAESYVNMKRNVLSPRTIKEYSEVIKRFPEWFCETPVLDIEQITINRLVNELSKDKAPKTVRNYHGFVSAVLGTFYPSFKISTVLPQKLKSEPYIPSQNDVRRILAEIKDTQYEIPITLACYGMRRSEICALQLEDIEGDIVHINKALVQNDKNEWIIKTTKTAGSTRSIIIPQALADKIAAQGYIYKGYPNSIAHYLSKIEKKIRNPSFFSAQTPALFCQRNVVSGSS